MKSFVKNNKGILFIVIFSLLFLVFMPREVVYINEYDTLLNGQELNIIEIDDSELVNSYLEEHITNIEYICNIFGINKDIVINNIKDNYTSVDLYNIDDFDKFLVDYLLELEDIDKTLFNNDLVPSSSSKEYIVALIKYFSNMYNVDFTIAASIAEVESSYTASYMLYCNNIYGGIYNGRLIRYKNIEYGVLKYIKLLSDGYFNKGLDTITEIGAVYNPVVENGVRYAKPVWVNNVSNALERYMEHDDVTINDLVNLRNVM